MVMVTFQGLRWDSEFLFVICTVFLVGCVHLPVSVLLSFRTDQGVSWINFFVGVCHCGFDGQMMEEGKKKR